MFYKFILYFNTIKYLKYKQIFNRLFFKKKNIYFYKNIDQPLYLKNKNIEFLKNKKNFFQDKKIIQIHGKRYLLNELDWGLKKLDKLSAYKLNYFDDLNSSTSSLNYEDFIFILNDWVDFNKKTNFISWDPYPTSIRVVNLIKFALNNDNLDKKIINSIYIQSKFIRRNIEWHLMGNHILTNAKALIYAGVFFNTTESKKWLKFSLNLYKKQIKLQVLEDGGHFELSPMYQAIIIEDMLDIINILDSLSNKYNELIIFLRVQVNKMLYWLKVLSHPDGKISFFNDSTFDEAPELSALLTYAKNIKVLDEQKYFKDQPFVDLENSGYFIVKNKDLKLITDIANIKADYIPGHTHADVLSYELSIFNNRFIVNPGISTYENNSQRIEERGTKYHNTVTINNKNSIEIWRSFRVAKRSKITKKIFTNSNNIFKLSSAHNGYKSFFNNLIHHRSWEIGSNFIVVKDHLEGYFVEAVSIINIMPGWEIEEIIDEKIFKLKFKNKLVAFIEIIEGLVKVKQRNFSYTFGKQKQTIFFSLQFKKNTASYKIYW